MSDMRCIIFLMQWLGNDSDNSILATRALDMQIKFVLVCTGEFIFKY